MAKKKGQDNRYSSDDSSGDESDRNGERLDDLPDICSPVKLREPSPSKPNSKSEKRKSLKRNTRRSRSRSASDNESTTAPKLPETKQTNSNPPPQPIPPPQQRKRGGRYNNQPKHKCQLSEIPLSRPIVGQDTCSPGKPAMLTIEKLKLHYVVHYMLRETWTPVVPEEPEKGRIDSYQCNLCQRRFKNNIDKDEYPGRGSMICHIATDHGLLLEAMKEDDKVNMRAEIDKIAQYDPNFLANPDPAQKDPNTGKYEDLVTIKDSIMWKIKQKQKELAEQKSEDDKNGVSKPAASQDQPIIWKRPTKIPCPHCSEYDNNIDPANLRLHIFHHYKDVWMDKVDTLEKTSDNRIFCDVCPKRRGITGASVEGAILSTICHFAIQHGELRDILGNDERIEKEFLSELYKDQDRPEEYAKEKAQFRSYNYNYYQPSSKPWANITPVLVVNAKGEPISAGKTAISTKQNETNPLDKAPTPLLNSSRPVVKATLTDKPTTEEDVKKSDTVNIRKRAKEDMDWMDTTDEEDNTPCSTSTTKLSSRKNQVETVEQWKGESKKTVTDQSCKKVRRRKKAGNNGSDTDDGENSYLSNTPNENYVRKRKKLSLSMSDLKGGDSGDDDWSENDVKKENNWGNKSNRKAPSKKSAPSDDSVARVMPRRSSTMYRKGYNDGSDHDLSDEGLEKS